MELLSQYVVLACGMARSEVVDGSSDSMLLQKNNLQKLL
jgi:hypothetical protein